MSFTAYVDRDRQATTMTAEEEDAVECHRKDCDSPVEDTKPCERCGLAFCPAHLYEGWCADCMEIDIAAHTMNVLEGREAA